MAKDTELFRGVFPGENGTREVQVRMGTVESVSEMRETKRNSSAPQYFFLPTLFDIQVNGANGIDLQDEKLCVDALWQLNAFMQRNGVSQWVPTLVTNSAEAMERGCRVMAEARKDAPLRKAIPGVHLEGPHISPEDGPRGAHPLAHVCPPDTKLFDRLWRASEGAILYTTLSPELPGAAKYIRHVTTQGCTVSLGHHNASAAQIHAAVEAGARLCTHLGNGAHPQMHRHQNPIWPQLAEDRLMASIIADLHHLPAPVLKTFARCKGPRNIVLVSDAVHLAGMKPGRYELFGGTVQLHKNGKIAIPGTQLLAGSGLMLLRGVFNLARHTDFTLKQALACATLNPARLLGVRTWGTLPKPGQKAGFMMVDVEETGESMHENVRAVFVDGSRVA